MRRLLEARRFVENRLILQEAFPFGEQTLIIKEANNVSLTLQNTDEYLRFSEQSTYRIVSYRTVSV